MKNTPLLPVVLAAITLWQLSPAIAQKVSKPDSVRIMAMLDMGTQLKDRSLLDSADHVCRGALLLSEGLKDSLLIALSSYRLGQVEQATNHKEAAMAHFQRALSARLEKDQSVYTAVVYNDIGYWYGSKGDLDKQREWYLRAMRLYDRNGDLDGMAETLSNLSGSSLELGKKKDAITYAFQALAIRERVRDTAALALSYNNISQIYLQMDSMERAVHYQGEGMRYAALSGSKLRLAQSYTGMSLLMNKQGKNREALEYEKKAIALCRETGDSSMLAKRCIAAAWLSGHLGDSVAAVAYFEESEKVSRAVDDKFNLRDLYLYRTIFYKEHKDFFKAYENLKLYHVYKDSIVSAETESNIADIQARYETEKKDKAIGELVASEKIKDQELRLALQEKLLMIGGILLLLVIGGVLFNRFQLKKRLEQQQALLEMRNKIARDLHDELGSTLTSIQILSQVSRKHLGEGNSGTYTLLEKIIEQSGQMQQSMSDIVWAIRSDNDKIENMIVRMREYLAQTLEARAIRIGFRTGEELLGYSFTMQQRKDIFLVFKEAVNNAAKYANCKHMDVDLRRCGGRILLEMRDDGVGFDKGLVRSSNGLKNMQARADQLGAVLCIETGPGMGTLVRLEMPA